jgi:hypothetical protein
MSMCGDGWDVHDDKSGTNGLRKDRLWARPRPAGRVVIELTEDAADQSGNVRDQSPVMAEERAERFGIVKTNWRSGSCRSISCVRCSANRTACRNKAASSRGHIPDWYNGYAREGASGRRRRNARRCAPARAQVMRIVRLRDGLAHRCMRSTCAKAMR